MIQVEMELRISKLEWVIKEAISYITGGSIYPDAFCHEEELLVDLKDCMGVPEVPAQEVT